MDLVRTVYETLLVFFPLYLVTYIIYEYIRRTLFNRNDNDKYTDLK